MKQYLVIERFKPDCFDAVYHRFEKLGRQLPDGLVYLDSWITEDQSACYQLMKTADQSLFDAWITRWQDLVEFEIIPLKGTQAS